MLHIPLSDDHFVLQTDASGKGVAGVLCVLRQGLELPVAFFSRQLRQREQHYAVTELECLAALESVRHFEVLLHDREFTLQMDLRAL